MLTAQQQGKLTQKRLLELMHYNPARLIGIMPAENDQVDISMEEYEIKNEALKTKAGWSPFAGRKVVGKIEEVRLAGSTVFKDGKTIASPGSGNVL